MNPYPAPKAPRQYAAAIVALPTAARAAALAEVPAALRDWVGEHVREATEHAPSRRVAIRHARVQLAAEILRLPLADRDAALERVRSASRGAVLEIMRRLGATQRRSAA